MDSSYVAAPPSPYPQPNKQNMVVVVQQQQQGEPGGAAAVAACCAFCGAPGSAHGGRLGRMEGPFNASVKGYEPVWVHHECAVWSPKISMDVLYRLRSVGPEVRRARNLRCSVCGRSGAALGCRVPACPKCFHLPCAIQQGCRFNFDLYLVSCSEHAAMFKSEPAGQPAGAAAAAAGPLSHLRLAGKQSAAGQHTGPAAAAADAASRRGSSRRSSGWSQGAGGLKRRNRLTAEQLGEHLAAAEAAFLALSGDLAAAAEESSDDEAVFARKKAKQLSKAGALLAPTQLSEGVPRAPQPLPQQDQQRGRDQPPHQQPQRASAQEQQEQERAIRAQLQRERAAWVPPPGGFAAVGGLDGVKQQLRETVLLPLTYPGLYEQLGIKAPRGILLHGPPGTGKTALVRALASECAALASSSTESPHDAAAAAAGAGAGQAQQQQQHDGATAVVGSSGVCGGSGRRSGPPVVSLFARKGTDCLGKYAGDAELHLRLLFEMAAASAPSIIFLDELDGLVPPRSVRSGGSDQIFASVVSVLLALMDGLSDRGQVMVIGATNRPDSIDPALRRPGRFDREVHVNLPSRCDRELILGVLTRGWVPRPPPRLLQQLAAATEGWAGADLQSLSGAALMSAIRRATPGLLAAADAAADADAAAAEPDSDQQQEPEQQLAAESLAAADCDAEPTTPPAAAAAAEGASDDSARAAAAPAAGGGAECTPDAAGAAAAGGDVDGGLSSQEGNGFLAALEDFITERHEPQLAWLPPPVQQQQVKQQDEQQQQQQQNEQQEQRPGQKDESPAPAAAAAPAADASSDEEMQEAPEDAPPPAQQQQLDEQQQQQSRTAAAARARASRIAAALSEVDVLPADWHSALAAMGPPASKRGSANLAALNPAAPLAAPLAPLLLPALAAVVRQLAAWMMLGPADAAAWQQVQGRGAGSGAAAAQEQLLVGWGAVEAAFDSDGSEGGGDAGSNQQQQQQWLHSGDSSSSSPRCLLLSGHAREGQAEVAAAVLKLLDNRAGAAVSSLALPALLLAGDGCVSTGLVAAVRGALGRCGRQQTLVLYLPRLELWALEAGRQAAGAQPVAAGGASTKQPMSTAAQQQQRGWLGGASAFSGAASGMQGVLGGGSSSSSSDDDKGSSDGSDSGSEAQADAAGQRGWDQLAGSRRQKQQRLQLSAAWSVFEQQLGMLHATGGGARQVLLLATSHLPAPALPAEVQQVFAGLASSNSSGGVGQHSGAIVEVCAAPGSSSRAALQAALRRAAAAPLPQAAPGLPASAGTEQQEPVAALIAAAAPSARAAADSAAAAPAAQQQQQPVVREAGGGAQLNAAQAAEAQQLLAQVQQLLAQLSTSLLGDPRMQVAAVKQQQQQRRQRARQHAAASTAAAAAAAVPAALQELQASQPLAAVCVRALRGWYWSLDAFADDLRAAAAAVRCAAGSRGFSAAVAAASGLEDAAAEALYAARQQLRLGEPGRMRLLQAAAASREAA